MTGLQRVLSLALVAVLALALLPAACAEQNNFYIIPDSDTRYLTAEELWTWQYEAVGYIYNEIFARHGRSFRSGEKYDRYFRSQAWYSVNPSYRFGLLNGVEVANEQLAHEVLKAMRAQKTLNLSGKPLPTSNAAAGADSGFMFHAYRLRGDQKLAVYSGPGTQYYRGANGKASVSTNGDVNVAGFENGWLLVEYATSGQARRVGYIDMRQLSGKAGDTGYLEFFYDSGYIVKDCNLTDDPNGAQGPLMRLRANTTITLLSTYAGGGRQWAYIEVTGDMGLTRGFVPVDCVSGQDSGYNWEDEAAYGEVG